MGPDPREIDLESLREITREAPIPIDIQERSDNAAEPTHTLIGVSILFMALVWNPFVTTFANEASKDAYAAVRTWLKKLAARLARHANPILEIQSFHRDCQISFMLRGRDVARHYKAIEAVDSAAARAAHLVAQMQAAHLIPVRLVYEFLPTEDIWYPSYAELSDGRLVTDNAGLIAVEKLPTALSLGIIPASLSEPN